MKFDAFVAHRYLRAKRKQAFIGVISLITLIGITLGVAALNIALAVHNGMRQAFVQSLVGESGQIYVVAGFGADGFLAEEVEQILKVLDQSPEVKAVSMMRQQEGVLISRRKQMAFAKLQGIFPGEHLKVSNLLRSLEHGRVEDLEKRPADAPPGIILGYDLANQLGVRPGDFVQAAIPRLASPGLTRQGLRFKEMKCEVVGIFRSGNSQFDQLEAYLHLRDLMMMLNTQQIQALLVGFDSLAAMDRAKQRLMAHPDLPVNATVVDLRDLNRNLLKALKLEKAATTTVIGLFILVVGLNMISALTMLVMEKHRDIGIMKSFGTPKPVILMIFIRQGMTLSLAGTALGTVLGVTLAMVADATRLIQLDNNVYEVLNYLPFKVSAVEVVSVAVGSLVLSFLSALYPARQAASVDPVEALKYD